MRAFGIGIGVAACSFVAASGVGSLQIGHDRSFDELKTKADAVAIAEYNTTTEVRRGVEHPDLTPALPSIEMESVFTVQAFMKTDTERDATTRSQIRLKHYRIDLAARPVNTGSQLMLKTGAVYLLFLKRGESGRYLPLSGLTFPTDSVFLLEGARAFRR
jgi:hypothetical protein